MTRENAPFRIRIAVVFCCHDGRGNVLLARRGPKARNGCGQWDIGGGEAEYGEPVEFAARREMREEYGVDVDARHLVPLGFREIFQFEGVGCHWISFDFAVRIDPSRVSNPEGPEKFSEMRWFPFGRWPDPLYSKLPEFLEKHAACLPGICGPSTDPPPASSWTDDPGLVNAAASLPSGQWRGVVCPSSTVAEHRVVLPPHEPPRPEDRGRPVRLPPPPLPAWWSATEGWLEAYGRIWAQADALRARFPGRWVLMGAADVLGDFSTHVDGYRAAADRGIPAAAAILFRPDELY